MNNLSIRHNKMNERYSPVKGAKVFFDGIEWEFTQTNHLGVPYFVKVKNNKTQKTQYVLSGYDKEWLDNQLSYVSKYIKH